MRSRFRIAMVGALAIFSGACAASTTTGGGGGGAGPGAIGDLPEGERPRENNQTREAQRQLGMALIATGDAAQTAYEGALAQAQAAIAADSTNPLPWKQAGEAYVGLGDYVAADEAFDRAEALRPVYKAEIDPVREQAWIDIYNQGAEIYNANDRAGAAELLEQGNVIYDARPEIMMFLGQVQMELGEDSEAADNLMRALEIIRSDAVANFDSATVASWREQEVTLPPAIAQSLMNAERLDEAIAFIRPLLEEDPANAPYARSLASLYARTGQTDSARVVFQRLEQAAGADLTPFDYYVIGTGYIDMEAFESAAASFGRALQMVPQDRDAAEWRARALNDLVGVLEEANQTPTPAQFQALIAAAQAWVDLDPHTRSGHLMLAQSMNKMGNADTDAVADVIEALETLPFYVENLQLMRGSTGGGMVSGDVINRAVEAGQSVTFRFTFFGLNGQQLGTQEVQVRMPPAEAAALLEVDFEGDQDVYGYTYQVVGQ